MLRQIDNKTKGLSHSTVKKAYELYQAIDEGIADIKAGRVSDFHEFARQFREEISDGQL